MSAVTIFHNPRCGTSRNTLALIRNAGIEPTVVAYLETPPWGDGAWRGRRAGGLWVGEGWGRKKGWCRGLV